jgi:hypothetical protein
MAVKNHIEYRVDADTKPYKSKMAGMQATTATTGSAVISQFKAMGAAIAGALSFALVKRLTQMADDMGTFADATGISVEYLQRFEQANIKFGVSAESARKGLEKFNVNIGKAKQGTGELKKALDDMGISFRDGNGRMRTTEEMLSLVADGIAKTTDGSIKAVIAMAAFGKSGAEMAASVGQGSEAFTAAMDGATVLSEHNTRMLAGMNADFESTGKTALVWAANIFGAFSYVLGAIPRMAGAVSGGAGVGDSLLALVGWTPDGEKDIARLEKIIKSQAEAKQHALDEQTEAEKKITTEREKQLALIAKDVAAQEALVQKEMARLDKIKEGINARGVALNQSRADTMDKRTGFTVSEAAGGGLDSLINEFGLSAEGRKNQGKINQAAFFERAAKAARFNGRDDLVQSNTDRANEIRASIGALTADERNPFMSIDEGINELKEATILFQKDVIETGIKLKAP